MAKSAPSMVLAALARQAAHRLQRRNKPQTGPTEGGLAATSSEAVTTWLVDLALSGFGPLESAEALARRYQQASHLHTDQQRIDAMVRYESGKSFTAGFLTSLPMPLALPAMLPVALLTTWLIQARLVAAMAILMGHAPDDLWVRTTVLLALDDARTPTALKDLGLDAGQWAAMGMAQHLTQPIMGKLWRHAGEQLLKQATRRGWGRVGRLVPLVGAVLAGGLDAYGCQQVAKRSRSLIVPAHRALT